MISLLRTRTMADSCCSTVSFSSAACAVSAAGFSPDSAARIRDSLRSTGDMVRYC